MLLGHSEIHVGALGVADRERCSYSAYHHRGLDFEYAALVNHPVTSSRLVLECKVEQILEIMAAAISSIEPTIQP